LRPQKPRFQVWFLALDMWFCAILAQIHYLLRFPSDYWALLLKSETITGGCMRTYPIAYKRPMLPEKRVSVVLPGDLHRDLKLHAYSTQMTMNDVLLKALQLYLNKTNEEKWNRA